jgi:hypothetical protein
VRWAVAFGFSLGFIDQLSVFRMHVPSLARVVINAGIRVNPDRTGERRDGSADEEQEGQKRFEHGEFDRRESLDL